MVHGDFNKRMATRTGKISKARRHLFVFPNPATNAIIYCSYLMTTREESMEEEQKSGDDSQCNDFISLSRFELLKCLLKRACSHLILCLYYFMMLVWTYILLERDIFWRYSMRKSSRQFHNKPFFFFLVNHPIL